MAKIPKFKNRQEEREFWASHDFADYAADTTDVARPKDTNATRRKSWTVNAYLTHEEGLALAELAKNMGESKSTILRQALNKFINAELASAGPGHASVHSGYLDGIDLEHFSGQVTYVGVFMSTDSPSRDVDLARVLKSLLQIALPVTQVEVMLKRAKPGLLAATRQLLPALEIKGKLTKRDLSQLSTAIRKVAERSIGQRLRGRHLLPATAA